MSRIELAKIKSLTFYHDEWTKGQRTAAIPQLVCHGTPCSVYQPEAVRCQNIGGHGTDVDWKCEADLPESLRFGKVEVSCEGWSKPGDPYVLKGSCSLDYRLVQIPGTAPLRSSESDSWNVGGVIFSFVWIAFLVLIVYSIFQSCLQGTSRVVPGSNSGGPRPGSSGWFPGGHNDDSNAAPPPPYTKDPPRDAQAGEGWRPGFWTGAAVAGLGAHLWNQNRRDTYAERRPWDWERDRTYRSPMFGGRRPASDDRGEGSSNLGSMRRSTGFGGSNVR